MEYWVSAVDAVNDVLPDSYIGKAAIGAAAGWLLMRAFQPSFAYNAQGKPYANAIFPDLLPGAQPATYLSAEIGPLVGGLIPLLLF